MLQNIRCFIVYIIIVLDLFLFGCLEVNSTWLITSELANQRTRKALFTCVVYTNNIISSGIG